MKARSSGKNKGVSTLEVLIAFAVLTLCLTAAIVVVFSNQSVSVDTQTSAEALSRAEAGLEGARALSRQDFTSVASIATSSDSIYSKSLTVQALDATTDLVTSFVSWVAGGRTQYVRLSTLLANPVLGGDTCSPTVTGDWTEPEIYGYADFASSAGATGIDVAGTTAYVTSDPSSSGTDDFYAVDVTHASPTQGSLPVIGHFSTGYGLTDVHVAGTNAYVVADSAAYQVLVIDVSNPSSLSATNIKAKLDLTAAGDTAVGNTLYYSNKMLYIGLTISTGPEFYTIDVSNPAAPVVKGSYEVGAAVNGILVRNNIAYLATAANNQVIALDVSNAASPTLIDRYASATLTGQSLAKDSGSTLYFGRIGGNGNPKLLALDTGNLGVPAWTMDMVKQSGIYTLILRGSLLFMTTADPNDGLQIWDITNASASVSPVRFDTSPLNIQQTATAGTDCSGNLLYVAQRSQRALQIVGPYVTTPFNYALSTPANVSVARAGASKNTSVTATLTSGTTQSVTYTNSALPTGVSMSYSSNTCTPTCSTALTLSADGTASVGSQTITLSSSPLSKSTSFTLTVTAPAFTYALSTPGDMVLTHGGAPVQITEVVTMAAGATPQKVTLTAPNPAPADITVTPGVNPAACTPSAAAPYTCQILFTYSASATAKQKPYTNQKFSGSPGAVQSGTFKITVN